MPIKYIKYRKKITEILCLLDAQKNEYNISKPHEKCWIRTKEIFFVPKILGKKKGKAARQRTIYHFKFHFEIHELERYAH